MIDIVDKQLEYYNNRNLEKFLTCYDKKIQVYMLQSGKLISDGIENLEKVMGAAFQDTLSRSEKTNRIVQGNLIINQERITGHQEGKAITTVSIYEVTNGKITKLWFGGRQEEEV